MLTTKSYIYNGYNSYQLSRDSQEFDHVSSLNLVHFVEPPGNSKRSQITLSKEISLNQGKWLIMSRESSARAWQVCGT